MRVSDAGVSTDTDLRTGWTRRPAPVAGGSLDGADDEHLGALGRGDLAVIGILVCVMEIPRAQHAAADHHRSADHEALFRSVVLVRRIDGARLGGITRVTSDRALSTARTRTRMPGRPVSIHAASAAHTV